MALADSIERVMRDVAARNDKTLADDLAHDTVLLDCGLDSLDFAVVVARLEDEMDLDPFSRMDEPVYPRTFGDFVSIYQQFSGTR